MLTLSVMLNHHTLKLENLNNFDILVPKPENGHCCLDEITAFFAVEINKLIVYTFVYKLQ